MWHCVSFPLNIAVWAREGSPFIDLLFWENINYVLARLLFLDTEMAHVDEILLPRRQGSVFICIVINIVVDNLAIQGTRGVISYGIGIVLAIYSSLSIGWLMIVNYCWWYFCADPFLFIILWPFAFDVKKSVMPTHRASLFVLSQLKILDYVSSVCLTRVHI